MAKVLNPFYSESASGKFTGALRYRKSRGTNIVTRNKRPPMMQTINQLRQRILIKFIGELWRRPDTRGPEQVYQQFVKGVSGEGYLYYDKNNLMTWSEDQPLTTGEDGS